MRATHGYWLIKNSRGGKKRREPEDHLPADCVTALRRVEDRVAVLAAGFRGTSWKPVDSRGRSWRRDSKRLWKRCRLGDRQAMPGQDY